MSNNIEIVINIDTLEIFEVFELDGEKEAAVIDTEDFPEEPKTSLYDDPEHYAWHLPRKYRLED